MKNKTIDQLKEEYKNTDIPDSELKERIEMSIKKSRSANRKRHPLVYTLTAAAAALVIFSIPLNTINGFAASLDQVPVIGSLARVLTFRSFSEADENRQYEVEIDVPGIAGLDNTELQDSLNTEYQEEAARLYQAFMDELEAGSNQDLVQKALHAGYQVVPSAPDLLVIQRYVTEIDASGAESVSYDVIDTDAGLLVTLPMLFKDDQYIRIISDEILRQMEEQQAADESIVYFTSFDDGSGFEEISADQTFYINEDNKLIVVFDEYEVAPGYMGTVEFEIPTDIIRDQLAGGRYIK